MNIHKITCKEIDSNHNVQQRQNAMNNNKHKLSNTIEY